MTHEDGFFASQLLPSSVKTTSLVDCLRANIQPSDAEAHQLRMAVSRFPAEVDEYDKEIARLQASLARLTEERSRMQIYSNASASILSPIRSIPTELLLAILSECVDFVPRKKYTGRWTKDGPDIDDALHMSWRILGTVCCQWRTAIKGAMQIWRVLDFSAVTINDTGIAIDTADRAMRAARNSSLVLRLRPTFCRGAPYTVYAGFGPTLKAVSHLLAYPERLTSLKLIVNHNDLNEMQYSFRNILFQLEELELETVPDVHPHKSSAPRNIWAHWRVFESLPALKTFTFTGTFTTTPPPVPWAQLTHVHFKLASREARKRLDDEDGPLYSLFSFLEHCTEHCTVVISGLEERHDPEYEHWPTQPTLRSALHALHLLTSTIDGAGRGEPIRILQLLDLPNVAEVRLDAGGYYRGHLWNPAIFSAFVNRSPLLTALHLLGVTIAPMDLISALRQTPLLQRLSLEDHAKSHKGLFVFSLDNAALRVLSDTPYIAPRLADLTLVSYFQFSEALLADLLAVRATHNRRTGQNAGRTRHPFVFRGQLLPVPANVEDSKLEDGTDLEWTAKDAAEISDLLMESAWKEGLRFVLE
ncbi:F-box domain-containing protein [Mycena indigotica]|uniref:F-box domain-containing protein n=1 Tax=Mycena indigotica TaxID=2126181 RepID=A0A8H6WGL6_9AGAR|nr:F-box domain-containing protein [Mycena indigotica]KAF7315991.1 F-box domain-containing protein [Mycena indigotica]